MRSQKITRLYFQVPPDENIRQRLDDAIWDEMLARMVTEDGWKPNVGRILNKNVTAIRSFVTDPMCAAGSIWREAQPTSSPHGRQRPESGGCRCTPPGARNCCVLLHRKAGSA